ncbi:MAG TPA: Lrp/AsnC family transcriptional regulator [Candidatus Saccharimonadales bacterium]|nr:Lrp/AsnC family transcriptional regulator [Candidatus Saccharimonadales bacterium]
MIDSTDFKILAELVENAKYSFAEIGRKLSLHPNVVAYRINKLEKTGIIKDYRADLDLEKLGVAEQILVGASFPRDAERDEIIQKITAIPQTVKVVSSLGEPEGLVFLVGKNKSEIEKLMTKLRSLDVKIQYTGSIIRTFEDGRLGNFLKILAREHDETTQDSKNGPLI